MSIPIPRIVWPIVIEAGVNDGLDFVCDPSPGTTNYIGALTAGTYATPELLLARLVTDILLCVGGGNTFATDSGQCSASVSADGVCTINLGNLITGSPDPQFRWSTLAHAELGAILGFPASTVTGVLTPGSLATDEFAFVAPNQMKNFWTPGSPVAFDSGNTTEYARVQSRTMGGQSYTTTYAEQVRRRLRFELLAAASTRISSETSTTTNRALERLFDSTTGGFGHFTYSPDRSSPGTSAADYFLLLDSLKKFDPERYSPGLEVYAVELLLGAYSA
jgi:hypothetical protein